MFKTNVIQYTHLMFRVIFVRSVTNFEVFRQNRLPEIGVFRCLDDEDSNRLGFYVE